MRSSLTALTIWALCFSGLACGSARVQGPQSSEKKPAESPESQVLMLTQDRPSYSLPITAVAGNPRDAEVLEVAITKVINPSLIPIAFYVYLSDTEAGKSDTNPHLIGNFSLYPPNEPGKFVLGVTPALRNLLLSDTTPKGHLRLIFEMKRIDEDKAWVPVEVSIAQPAWRAAEK